MGDEKNATPERATDDAAYAKARTLFLGAAVAIALGLAVSGSVDRTAGGAVLLAGWGLAILALHRLGRTGSARRNER